MEKNEEYKQIYLGQKDDVNKLEGKVVDKVSIVQDKTYSDQNEVLITFKDKTFIALSLDDRASDDCVDYHYVIENEYVCHPSCYNNGKLDHTVNTDGTIRFFPKVQRRIDLGIWNVTEEEVQKLIAEYEKRSEQYEFQQYLRLKKKFDGRESEFSSNVQ